MSGNAGEEADSALGDGPAAEWAVARADELDLEVHEFLDRIMRAYRLAENGEAGDEAAPSEALDALRREVETLEADVAEMIEDVRNRVIQVKKEADAKAPADHDHEGVEETLQEVSGDLGALEDRVGALEERVEGGFANFEEILEYLVERTDGMAEDVETLGSAVVAMRDSMEQVAGRDQARARADRLKKKGAQRGVRSAKCDDCGAKVDLAMLADATCPTCDAVFQDLDPDPGFFGRSVLETGSRPALEAPGSVPDQDDIETVATGESRARSPDREDWFTGKPVNPGTEADDDEE